jgi:hypothetical protein
VGNRLLSTASVSTIGDLLDELAETEPALARLRDEHIAFNGELLPHVLFGDVTRWIVAHAPATHVLQVLERHIATGDADVDNLIGVSFLENLGPGETSVRQALGPRLRAELDALETWTPTDLDSPT